MGAKKGAKATKPKGKSAPQSGALQRTSLALECMDRVVHNLALQQQTPALRASKSKRKGNVAPATAKLLTAVSDTLGGDRTGTNCRACVVYLDCKHMSDCMHVNIFVVCTCDLFGV